MSLEHSPTRQVQRAAYSILEFCAAYGISRSKLYQEWEAGRGPRFMRVGTRKLITIEAAADWRREREAETLKRSSATAASALEIVSDGSPAACVQSTADRADARGKAAQEGIADRRRGPQADMPDLPSELVRTTTQNRGQP